MSVRAQRKPAHNYCHRFLTMAYCHECHDCKHGIFKSIEEMDHCIANMLVNIACLSYDDIDLLVCRSLCKLNELEYHNVILSITFILTTHSSYTGKYDIPSFFNMIQQYFHLFMDHNNCLLSNGGDGLYRETLSRINDDMLPYQKTVRHGSVGFGEDYNNSELMIHHVLQLREEYHQL